MSLSMENGVDEQEEMTSGFHEDLGYLRQVNLLKQLDYDCLKLLAMLSRRVDFIAGDHLMVQGEGDGFAFYILSGRIRTIYAEGDSELVIREYEPGNFFGGMALLARMVPLYSLVAIEETIALRLSRQSFQKAMQQFPGNFEKITGSLIAELINWDQTLLTAGRFDAESPGLGVSLL